jgi:hypothetical protein
MNMVISRHKCSKIRCKRISRDTRCFNKILSLLEMVLKLFNKCLSMWIQASSFKTIKLLVLMIHQLQLLRIKFRTKVGLLISMKPLSSSNNQFPHLLRSLWMGCLLSNTVFSKFKKSSNKIN